MKEVLEKAKYIDWKQLLINNYRNLDLKEEEVMILLVIDSLLNNNETIITPDLLALKMNYSQQVLDKHLSSLLNKNLINIEEDEQGKIKTTLNGIKYIVVSDFLKAQTNTKSENDLQKEQNLFEIFENQFGRPLSFVEMDTMQQWLQEGYEEDKIILALKEAVAMKKKNIRYIDKILLEWRQQEERKQEGYTTITKDWKKDIKETIEVANLAWVKKNED